MTIGEIKQECIKNKKNCNKCKFNRKDWKASTLETWCRVEKYLCK